MGIFKFEVAGNISIFKKNETNILKKHIPLDEEPLFCLKGGFLNTQALIVFASKIFIMKFKDFGEYNSASFFYRDIINIETAKGFMYTSLKICTPVTDNIKDNTVVAFLSPPPAFLASNCFSFQNAFLPTFLPYIEKIRTLVRESKKHSEGSSQKSDDGEATKVNIAEQIEKLSNLRQTGALSEEEYLQAKKKILEA